MRSVVGRMGNCLVGFLRCFGRKGRLGNVLKRVCGGLLRAYRAVCGDAAQETVLSPIAVGHRQMSQESVMANH